MCGELSFKALLLLCQELSKLLCSVNVSVVTPATEENSSNMPAAAVTREPWASHNSLYGLQETFISISVGVIPAPTLLRNGLPLWSPLGKPTEMRGTSVA